MHLVPLTMGCPSTNLTLTILWSTNMTVTIKKAYTELNDLLVANKGKKVEDILEAAQEIMAAKKGARAEGGSFIRDEAGNVVAILDYYYKRWMPLVGDEAVEFGLKKSSTTGYNTMCKAGVSAWTRQQREATQANEALLSQVAEGKIKPENIKAEQDKIEARRTAIEDTDLGFATREELDEYLANNKVKIAA